MAVATRTPSTGTLPWNGIFDTPEEADTHITEVEGSVPEGLVGTLYRNGPGKLDLADHLFDGDGMVSMIRFEPDGSIRFRNRFVRTRKYQLELEASRPRVSGYGTRAAGGVLRNALRAPSGKSNAANTNVMFSAGRLLALWEAGRPWQLDPETLETLGEMDFDGALTTRHWFSAHPHWDPDTREIFNFGMTYGPKNAVDTYRIDPSGTLRHLRRVPIPKPVMNHDFIVTDRYLVFCLGPVQLSVLKLLGGVAAFGDALKFRHEDPTLIVLVPRDGGEPIYVEAEPWFQFHYAAAFDDGDDVVIDLVRYPDYESIGRPLKNFREAGFEGTSSHLYRYRVSPVRRTAEGQRLTAAGVEFPQVDHRRATGGYSTIYAAFIPPEGGLFDGVGRIDVDTGRTDVHHFGAGRAVSEPVFVPRPEGEAEDDGWLVGLVYDPDRRAGDAVVLDAREPSQGPLCTVRLPVNTGLSFHGFWRAPRS